eukprot:CAMPEP_0203763570 /NCGR_PEP_ID=MMETSP0098-20131031/16421_1 /ASSEMBLY_ACC=CAM_ASM_000208 /TAXON_ID=96639 /ORGANISM=" , Strain NY0313808BC1" /LENGTH=594 /DNA_ID=CAMNT_0050658533 /DNA_START=388 /DNA_END=2169 /DNA_ORIENTATION=-
MVIVGMLRAVGIFCTCCAAAVAAQTSWESFEVSACPTDPRVIWNAPTWEACPFPESVNSLEGKYVMECYYYNAPLDWKDKGPCDKGGGVMPMWVKRIYSKHVDPATAEASLVMANPGGPGGSEESFFTSSLVRDFHSLTDDKKVYYVQKVRGVSGEGAIACENNSMVNSFLGTYTAEEERCIKYVLDHHGHKLKLIGYEQMSFDLRYTLSLVRASSREGNVYTYGISAGTRFLLVYLGMFTGVGDQFDGYIFDGTVNPGEVSLARTYGEGQEAYTRISMTNCLDQRECWGHFRGLKYIDNENRSRSVVSIVRLYEHLVNRLHDAGSKSRCVRRLAKISGESIAAHDLVLAFKSAMASWIHDIDSRPLISASVLRLYYCEYGSTEKIRMSQEKNLQALLFVYRKGVNLIYDHSLRTEIQSNLFTGASMLLNEYTTWEHFGEDLPIFESFSDYDNPYYDRSSTWGIVRMMKILYNEKYKYDFDINITMRARTDKPVLILNGDMDPATPEQTMSDYFGQWDSTANSKHLRFVVPSSPHGTVFSGRSTYKPHYTCGLQLLTSFVNNNGTIPLNDRLCLQHPVMTDFEGRRQHTLQQVK